MGLVCPGFAVNQTDVSDGINITDQPAAMADGNATKEANVTVETDIPVVPAAVVDGNATKEANVTVETVVPVVPAAVVDGNATKEANVTVEPDVLDQDMSDLEIPPDDQNLELLTSSSSRSTNTSPDIIVIVVKPLYRGFHHGCKGMGNNTTTWDNAGKWGGFSNKTPPGNDTNVNQ